VLGAWGRIRVSVPSGGGPIVSITHMVAPAGVERNLRMGPDLRADASLGALRRDRLAPRFGGGLVQGRSNR
jgi:hypothetical protein